MSSESAVPRHTRPSNANKHPGEIVLQVKNCRCTTEEMTAAKDAKAAAVQAGIQRVAGIELEMEEKQVNALTRKAKPVCSPQKGKSKGKAISEKDKSLLAVSNGEAQGGLTKNMVLENNTDIEGLKDGPSKRKKKKGIRESIN
ncbi:hypothetical protein EDB19DRAFT_1834974 [Suillus lakei]|nr:hypothetical protein EDB19DRAFT_1834974 [Suillus lakei]